MAKKRRRKSTPNLPEAALEHARRQVEDDDGEATSADQKRAERAARRAERRARAARAREGIRAGNASVDPSTASASSSRKKSDKLDNETIQQLLANPTRVVSEEQLHEDYGHVVADIRNMFILAVILMVVLVAMAQFI
jgi:hypothetical protein